MTLALVSLETAQWMVAGFLLLFGLLLLIVYLEDHRPETEEEKRTHEYQAIAPDPWASFKPAGERRRLEAELREKEENLVDVAVIQVEHSPEKIICRKRVA